MKKSVCIFLLVIILLFSLSCNAETSSFYADDEDVCGLLEEALSQSGFDYYQCFLNSERGIVSINVAFDGLTSHLLMLKENGADETIEQWVQFKEGMSSLYASVLDFFKLIGREDLNLVISVVNDDAYIREDYSTISHNPLLCIGIYGIISIDEMEAK